MQRHWPNRYSKYHCKATDMEKGDRLGNECRTDVDRLGIGKVPEIFWLGGRGTGDVGAGNCQ